MVWPMDSVDVQDIPGERFVKAARRTEADSAGLDQFRPKALTAPC